ncbi:MAG: hypothetical protein IPN20_00505 [Haliscomenobacter sp.]|nr:hypothetical protein [Haliscomenobacter sp.]
MLLKEAIPLPMLPGKVFVRKNDIDKCPWPSLCSNMPLVTRYDFEQYDMGFVHELIGLVAGEASSNYEEALGIGCVIRNRLGTTKGETIIRNKDFLSHLGNRGQYDGANDYNRSGEKTPYYLVTHMSIKNAAESNNYGIRVRGAIASLSDIFYFFGNIKINNAYFWEGAGSYYNLSEPNYFRTKVNEETLVLVAELGKSVFFTYNPKLESSYKRGWP